MPEVPSSVINGLAAPAKMLRSSKSPTLSLAFLKSFFANWLKLDITTIAAALTIFGTISGLFRTLKDVGLKIYWWFTKFFTASISIASSDRLNREILNWLGDQILTRQGTRVLTARTENIQTDAYHRSVVQERNDYHHEKKVPIQYLPTFGTTWFILDRNIFLVRRIRVSNRSMGIPDEYVAAPKGDEPLIVMCLGRSVAPIKKFLDTCRDFAEKQRESFITVRATKDKYHREVWDTTILRPIRPLETVHFDENTRNELVSDIRKYLDPNTRRFYTARGIPYRRGYLLHGTPGTGKTSLSLALAGHFGLELYLVHLPSIHEDSELERLFTTLPPRCLVLLEDIDAVGAKRQSGTGEPGKGEEDEDEEDEDDVPYHQRSRTTLSGLLNVLDGVASQEGRIVLMTSNMAHKLDSALIRPGRIDKMIYLGNISPRSAELMFLRMYAPDDTNPEVALELPDSELEKLALEFSAGIVDDTITPAMLQGYLLNRRGEPGRAAREVGEWVAVEKKRMDEAQIRAQKARKWKAEKKKRSALNFLAKQMEREEGRILESTAAAAPGEKKADGDVAGKNEEKVVESEKVVNEGAEGSTKVEKSKEENVEEVDPTSQGGAPEAEVSEAVTVKDSKEEEGSSTEKVENTGLQETQESTPLVTENA